MRKSLGKFLNENLSLTVVIPTHLSQCVQRFKVDVHAKNIAFFIASYDFPSFHETFFSSEYSRVYWGN